MATVEEIRAKDVVPQLTEFRDDNDGFYGDGQTSFFMKHKDLSKELVKDAAGNTAATESDLVAGSKIPIMTASGPKSLPGNTIAKASEQMTLTTYVQNVAHSIAPDFDPTRTEDNPYKVGEYVMYEGVRRRFVSPHYGAWNSLDVVTDDVSGEQQEIYNKVNKLELETVGESKVFDVSTVWTDPQLNTYKKIGKQFAGKTLKFLVSCENPPATSCLIYFSETSESSSIIDSATLTATVGVPLEGEVPANANYIWLFSNTPSLTDKPINLSLFEISEQSLKSSIEILEVDVESLKNPIKPISVSYESDCIILSKKMSDGNDFALVFKPFGVNSLWQLKAIALHRPDGMILSSKTTSTDSVGPYQVAADTNADGDNLNDPKFTGGCHGYNGDQTGSATATSSIKVIADSIEKSVGNFTCNKIEFIVTNLIQGWNTRKEDGTGRAILKETVRYTIDSLSDDVKVDNFIEPLEDVTISLYYGMQIAFARNYVRFNSEKKGTWKLQSANASYVGDNIDSVDGRSDDGFVESMGVNPKGLGHFFYVPNNISKAFQSGKIYYNLIRQDLGLSDGDSVFFDAYYKFGYIGQAVTPLKYGSYAIDNVVCDKYFSIADLEPGTYKVRLYWWGKTIPEQVRVYTASSHVSTGIIGTYSRYTYDSPEFEITVTSNTKILWLYVPSAYTFNLEYAVLEPVT